MKNKSKKEMEVWINVYKYRTQILTFQFISYSLVLERKKIQKTEDIK